MVPSTPCPVLYGIRGDDENELICARSMIVSEDADRWIVFRSNQGTDDHVITEFDELTADRSYLIRGTVTEKAERIRGGHVFVETGTEYGSVTLGAYEPSKEFRMLFDRLLPGDTFEAAGELRDHPRTLNIEKIRITGLSENDGKISNPLCPSCGKHMKSVGA
jgi:tRNA(Ile2)-agmatinylcytidine synthase